MVFEVLVLGRTAKPIKNQWKNTNVSMLVTSLGARVSGEPSPGKVPKK